MVTQHRILLGTEKPSSLDRNYWTHSTSWNTAAQTLIFGTGWLRFNRFSGFFETLSTWEGSEMNWLHLDNDLLNQVLNVLPGTEACWHTVSSDKLIGRSKGMAISAVKCASLHNSFFYSIVFFYHFSYAESRQVTFSIYHCLVSQESSYRNVCFMSLCS